MLEEGLARYLSAEQRQRLAAARVGIAGCGGLGSNVAMMLARSGVVRLLLIDGDRVEPSNLNRQHFFPRHLGEAKATALAAQLRELRPGMQVREQVLWLERGNIPALLPEADIWVEALDNPTMKRDFVECALEAGAFVVSASGIAGWGGPPMQRRDFGDKLILVGDFATGIDVQPPLAPRVTQAAALQADAVLERILGPVDTGAARG